MFLAALLDFPLCRLHLPDTVCFLCFFTMFIVLVGCLAQLVLPHQNCCGVLWIFRKQHEHDDCLWSLLRVLFVWNLSMGGSLNVSEDPGYGSRSVLIAHALCACFKRLGWK